MKRFRFGLQRVLDYRETVEEALLAELGAVRARHEREMARLSETIRESDVYREEMRGQLSTGDPDEIRRAYQYQQRLLAQVLVQEAVVRQIKERKDRKTAEVIEASKDRKALDRLREYEAAQHRCEAERQEQGFLDDVAGVRHGRSARES